jgi:glutathione-independent formaldehyde dehydrogenase
LGGGFLFGLFVVLFLSVAALQALALGIPKGQKSGTGQANVKAYNRKLRELIITGKAKPSSIVSHEVPLDQAASAYQKFDERKNGWTKVVLKHAA